MVRAMLQGSPGRVGVRDGDTKVSPAPTAAELRRGLLLDPDRGVPRPGLVRRVPAVGVRTLPSLSARARGRAPDRLPIVEPEHDQLRVSAAPYTPGDEVGRLLSALAR